MSKILVLDNYDSFTYNLVHYVEGVLNEDVDVFRNDAININSIDKYDKIILSPGPGLPSESGILMEVIKRYAPTKSILGVCLGHQAIAETFGGSLYNLSKVYHGIATEINVLSATEIVFKGLPSKINVGRYHSWNVAKDNFPKELEITSVDEKGLIMSLRHKKYDVCGVQFHPESILTDFGKKMIENWILTGK